MYCVDCSGDYNNEIGDLKENFDVNLRALHDESVRYLLYFSG